MIEIKRQKIQQMTLCTKISAMSCRILLLFLLARLAACDHSNQGFTFPRQLKLDGVAQIDQEGVLTSLNAATRQHKGQVFYSLPFQFKNSSETTTFSFSTTFVFSLNFRFPVIFRNGISFFISPTKPTPEATLDPDQLQHASTDFFSIGLGTKMELTHGYIDTNDTHLEIKINGATSIKHSPLSYFTDVDGELQKLDLTSEEPMQVWVEYDGRAKELNVTLSPLSVTKPGRPLLSTTQDLNPLMSEDMYVGISTYNSPQRSLTNHYILAWSFKVNGQAQEFDRSQLAKFTPNEKGFIRIKEWKIIKLKTIICTCVGNLTESSLNSTAQHTKQRASRKRLRGRVWAA